MSINLNIIGTTTQFLIVSLLILKAYYKHESIDTKDDQLTSDYDYIVVGSGSAGSIIAYRLAEDGKTRVLLLEAGLPTDVTIDIPNAATTSQHFFSRFDWNYTMDPQPVGRAFVDGVIPENRGFAIGGSSSINTMIVNRGNRKDYDAWEQQYGAVGWSYDKVLPFFNKWEGNRDPYIVSANPDYHNVNGPIGVSTWATPDPLMVLHQKAINEEAGIPTTDINGPNQLGTTIAQAFIDSNGIRSSASNSYIDPNPLPHNLHILSGALVTKVLFDGKKATGVLFERKGNNYKVIANKEVILSAGAHNSAQLLMLSGIGPKEHLQKFNIPVIEDLPVGDNFQNHPGIDFNFIIKPESRKLLNPLGRLTVQQLYQWFTTGAGPLSSYYRAVTYLNTKNNAEHDWPNVDWEVGIYLYPENQSDFRTYQFGERKQEWQQYLQDYLGQPYLFVHPILQRVRSRGYVRLQSADPHKPPLINPNFLRDPLDMQDYLEVVQSVLSFYELSSISEHLVPLKPIPGCSFCPDKRYIHECEPYLRCAIEQIAYTCYHSSGSCRMGAPERKDTVVDPKCQVKGIKGLRVCDASIAPLMPNSNTNAMSLMIGEKCAHIIKQQI